MRGGIHQTSVNTRQRPGVPGMPVDTSLRNDSILLINKDPQANEVWTLEITAAADDTDYGILLDDPATTVQIDSGTGATVLTIATALLVAWQTAPIANGIASVASDGVDTLTFTGVYPGVAFGLTEGEAAASMTLLNGTNAAEADSVPFGRAMISTEFESDENDELGILAKSSALSARVSNLEITYAAGEIYSVTLTVEGRDYTVDVAADTNDDDTATAIRAAVNAMMPAASVIAAGATNNVLLTAELAGQYFEIGLGLVSGTTARMVLTDTTNTPACDFNQVFAGISQHTYDTSVQVLPTSTSDDTAEYLPNAGVTAMTRGPMWVEVASGTTITSRSKTYVELDGTGSAAGRFYTATGATRTLVDPRLLRWRRAAHSDSDANVAVVEISLAA